MNLHELFYRNSQTNQPNSSLSEKSTVLLCNSQNNLLYWSLILSYVKALLFVFYELGF